MAAAPTAAQARPNKIKTRSTGSTGIENRVFKDPSRPTPALGERPAHRPAPSSAGESPACALGLPADRLARARADARLTLKAEAQAIDALAQSLGERFDGAVAALIGAGAAHGRIVATGMGKSGHVAAKIASTFASTGSPAFFMHPAEAAHGDLGMVARGDAVLAFSHSGQCPELLRIAPAIKSVGAVLIVVTGNPLSPLARAADWALDTAARGEAPQNGALKTSSLTPTSSALAAMAMGDALAMAVCSLKGFEPRDYALTHPGGALGSRLKARARDVMRQGAELPVCKEGDRLLDALWVISGKGLGLAAVLGEDGKLSGALSDGDLRRFLAQGGKPDGSPVREAMSRAPICIGPDEPAASALSLMRKTGVACLLVADANGALLGAIPLRDLLV